MEELVTIWSCLFWIELGVAWGLGLHPHPDPYSVLSQMHTGVLGVAFCVLLLETGVLLNWVGKVV